MNAKRKIDPALPVWGICTAFLLLIALWMPPGGHWITDGGNKFMVMENFLLHRTLAMQNPAAGIDPVNQFFPDAVFHFQKRTAGIYSVFPPYFSLLTAPFYQIAGLRGKYFLPLLGAVLSLLLVSKISAGWRLRQPWLIFAAAFATPLAFYSVEFWEMTSGTVPVLGMLLLLQKRKDFYSGLALAGGLWFRPEMFFFAAVTGLVLFLTEKRRTCRFAAGFLAGFLPYGVTQTLLFGHITGIHGTTYADTSRRIFWNFYYYFFSCRPVGLAAGVAALALGSAPRFRGLVRWKTILGVVILGWSLYLLREISAQPQPVFHTVMTVGLFTTTPFVYFLAANWRPLWNHPLSGLRLPARITLLYTLILPPLLTSSDLGIIWGARHWLFLLPLMVPLAWFTARTKQLRLILILLFLISAGFQIHGLQIQKIMRQNACVLSEFLRKNTQDVILTDVFFLPMQTPELFRERRWLFVKDGTELQDAVQLLRERQIPFSFVRSPHGNFRRIGNESLAELLKQVRIPRKPQKIKLDKTSFLEVEIFPMEHR